MSAGNDPAAWTTRADEDALLARLAFQLPTPVLYGVCFHAQQCAEKYLKALLIANGRTFPRTHDLAALHDLCDQAGIAPSITADQLDALSAYAVQTRYPGVEPTVEEAEKALEIAEMVRVEARRLLGLI